MNRPSPKRAKNWLTLALCISAGAMAGLVVKQIALPAGAVATGSIPLLESVAQANMVTESGEYVLLTSPRGDSAETLTILDRKTGMLMVYSVQNNRSLELFGAFSVDDLFEEARTGGANNNRRRRR